jgi:hypothetical protein
MCYSGTCPNELWSGECGGGNKPCPEMYETDEEYEEARQEAQDLEDIRGDYLYEQEKDRRLFG